MSPAVCDAAVGNAAQSIASAAFTTLVETGSGLQVELPFSISGTVNPIPEPATSALMLLGALAVVGGTRRRLQQH